MEYVTKGTARLPIIGLGTARLLGQDCLEGVQHALSIGYCAVDTAQRYGNEEQVGAALKRSSTPRDQVYLTTKIGLDCSVTNVKTSTSQSLRRLQTDYIDLLLIHWPRPKPPIAETLGAMMELREAGFVRDIGVSNFPPSRYREAISLAPIVTNQVEYHPYLSQRDLLSISREHDLILTAYSPIARGRVLDDPVLQEIARRHGKGADQVTLRWLIQQRKVVTNPKSAHADRRIRNIDIFDFELSEEEMTQIHGLDRGLRVIDPPFAPDWERSN